MEPLSEVQMAVIDAALVEELVDLLDLPAGVMERYRVQVAARSGERVAG
ncbi:hypothetical protein [Actinocorallia populi]|nr:hypothetical protein [Actinocorallia populi]